MKISFLTGLMAFFTATASPAEVIVYKEAYLGNRITKLEIDDTGKAVQRIFERTDSLDPWKENRAKEKAFPTVSSDIINYFAKTEWLSESHMEKLKELKRYQVVTMPDIPGSDCYSWTIKLRKNKSEIFEDVTVGTASCGRYYLVKTSFEESRLLEDTFNLIENIRMYQEMRSGN